MTFTFGKSSDFSGGSFFKPGDHMADIAVVIEPISIEKEVPSTYNNVTRVRDEVLCDVTFFATTESVATKTPTGVEKGTKVVHGMLTSTLERNGMGNPFCGVIRRVPTKAGSGFAFRDVEDNAHLGLVQEWFGERQAEIETAAADAPSFD